MGQVGGEFVPTCPFVQWNVLCACNRPPLHSTAIVLPVLFVFGGGRSDTAAAPRSFSGCMLAGFLAFRVTVSSLSFLFVSLGSWTLVRFGLVETVVWVFSAAM